MTENSNSILPTHEEVVDWYDNHYKTEYILARPDGFYRSVLEMVYPDPEDEIKLLDVGCGVGSLCGIAMAEFRFKEAVGIDISLVALNRAKENFPRADFIAAEAHKLPFPDDYFDHVFSLGSVEHFPDVKISLKEMIRVTKPGGITCLLVPTENEVGTMQPIEHKTSLKYWNDLFYELGLCIWAILPDKIEPAMRSVKECRQVFYILS